jgi:predicted alpha/beta-hydrolase family hydrolase
MLFVQGTRDKLAEIDGMRDLCRALGKRATLHVVEGGDHSFNMLKRSGRDQSEVMKEIAEAVSSWIKKVA